MRRRRALLEAAAFGLAALLVAGFGLRSALAGLAVAVGVFVQRTRWTREVLQIRGGVVEAAEGRRPEVSTGLSSETDEVFAALERFASLVAAERAGSERARVLTRLVFDEVPVGLVVVDPSLLVLDANPAARRLFGLPATTRLHALVDLVRDPAVGTLFRQVLGGSTDEVPQALVRHGVEGGERLLEVSVRGVPSRHEPGGAAAISVVRDVTERERLEAMRRRFVADVSHELRTPIATIRAASETLAGEEELGPDVRRLVEIVARQAAEMQDLVSDLTDLAQIESGTVTLVVDRVDVGALLHDVVEDVAGAAEKRRVEVTVEAPAGGTVHADRRRLAQVFRNLVDNAVKFSSPGSRVDVLAELAESPDGPAVVVHVVDRGIGIPRGEQEKIFQRFYRVDPSRTKVVPGTGLGLAIVKHLLILHGGSIRVESEPRRGSRFTVTLPAAREGAGVLREAP